MSLTDEGPFRLSDRTVGLVTQTPEDCDDNAEQIAYHLAREVQASRKLIADLRALHAPEPDEADGLSVWCAECDPDRIDTYPCPTIRLIDTAEERA